MNLSEHLHTQPIFALIARASEGVPTYVVGGYVRDLLLGRPSKDIDIVCVGSGVALAERVAAQLPDASLAVFKSFGTTQVKNPDFEIEFVGARKESYERGSRKPAVEDGTLQDDQLRRDFTINALAISLNPENFGTLIDPFDGVNDLRRKTIRTPLDPAVTFSDDPLRMLRAIRFATRLNFDIDPDTFEGIMATAPRIEIISQERITEELNKILLTPVPSFGFKLLEVSGLLSFIFPELLVLKGVEQIDGKGHKDNFFHTLQVLDNVCKTSDDLWTRWAAVLHDIAKPATKRFEKNKGWTFHGHEELGAKMVSGIFRKFRLPLGEEMRKVRKLVRLHLRPIALSKDTITDSAVRRLMMEAGPELDDLMKLCRADITSKDGQKVKRYLANFDRVEALMHAVEEGDELRNFQPVLTGEHIMETFGIAPSREVGLIKIIIREAILEGNIKNTLEESIPLMLSEGAKLGLFPKTTETSH